MPLLLYPFKFRDPVTRRWVKARYVARLEVIKQRYAEFEIHRPSRGARGERSTFSPHRPINARDRDEEQ